MFRLREAAEREKSSRGTTTSTTAAAAVAALCSGPVSPEPLFSLYLYELILTLKPLKLLQTWLLSLLLFNLSSTNPQLVPRRSLGAENKSIITTAAISSLTCCQLCGCNTEPYPFCGSNNSIHSPGLAQHCTQQKGLQSSSQSKRQRCYVSIQAQIIRKATRCGLKQLSSIHGCLWATWAKFSWVRVCAWGKSVDANIKPLPPTELFIILTEQRGQIKLTEWIMNVCVCA